MVTGVGDARGRRANQDETVPFPLAFVAAGRGRRQDETTPFLLEFEVVSGASAAHQDETTPFLLELEALEIEREELLDLANPASGCTQVFGLTVTDSECDDWLGRVLEAHRSRAQVLPELKWRGLDASRSLCEYAARVASGEDLPPYRGPLLASGEHIDVALQGACDAASARSSRTDAGAEQARFGMARAGAGERRRFVRGALGLTLLAAIVVGSAVLGDDAELRAAGRAISHWLGGE